jgi:transcriptional regulator with XRE-family HTH domain
MAATESPAVARRRVWQALRHAREAKGMTQSQVADAMEWSLSKVMRIEKGEVSISATDLRAVLQLLDITDPVAVKQLMVDARTSRQERWSIDAAQREHLTPATVQLLQFEAEATAIRYYHPALIPGILQTEAYSRAVFDEYRGLLEDETIKIRTEMRRGRRRRVLERPDSPDYLTIFDQSVLLRDVGGPQVMAEQLQELLRLMDEAKIFVRVLPFAAGASIALLGPFAILDFGDEENAVLYREGPVSDEIIHSRREINRHRDVFERLWPMALDSVTSAELIKERVEQIRHADRRAPDG